MAGGKRKAEGIALLSLYNDDGDDEDDEEDEEEDEDQDEEAAFGSFQIQQEEADIVEKREVHVTDIVEKEVHVEMISETVSISTFTSVTRLEAPLSASEISVPTSPVGISQQDDNVLQSPVPERPGSGTRGIFVDYAHDEGALSPDAEEGEIMSTGRAVLALGAQIGNGFVQGFTPPSLFTQEIKHSEDQSPQFKLEVTQQSVIRIAPSTDSSDQEMIDANSPEKEESGDADTLADFLPSAPTEKCSKELQKKFAKYLAYKNAGRSFNEELRKSKGYRNPDFLQRAVKHQEIDQIGSCFRKDVFDPHGYDHSDFYDALALEFRREQERKELAKKQSLRVDFVQGGVQAPVSTLSDKAKPSLPLPPEQKDQGLPGSQGLTAASETASKSESARSNKKSKWDKVDADTKVPALMPTVAKSAIAAASAAHSALLTANAGGGYASFALQKRKEAEERSRGSERKSDRK